MDKNFRISLRKKKNIFTFKKNLLNQTSSDLINKLIRESRRSQEEPWAQWITWQGWDGITWINEWHSSTRDFVGIKGGAKRVQVVGFGSRRYLHCGATKNKYSGHVYESRWYFLIIKLHVILIKRYKIEMYIIQKEKHEIKLHLVLDFYLAGEREMKSDNIK